MTTQIIEFTTLTGQFIGRVHVKDGEFEKASNDAAEDMIESYSGNAEDFVKNFSQWNNGYIQSELITE